MSAWLTWAAEVVQGLDGQLVALAVLAAGMAVVGLSMVRAAMRAVVVLGVFGGVVVAAVWFAREVAQRMG